MTAKPPINTDPAKNSLESIGPRWHPKKTLVLSFNWGLAQIYLSLAWVHQQFLKKQKWTSNAPPLPLLIIGSYRMGGAGKTSLTICLYKKLQKMGYRPLVLTKKNPGLKIPSIFKDKPLCQDSDDTLWIRNQTGANVVCTQNRFKAWMEASEQNKFDCILSDDGLQDPRLLGATRLLCHPRLEWPILPRPFPLGPDRAILRWQKTNHAYLFDIKKMVDLNAGPMCFSASLKIPDDLKTRQFILLTGVGNPHGVIKLLKENNLEPFLHKILFDHSQATHKVLNKLLAKYPDYLIALTLKDAVRLPEIPPRVRVLNREVRVSSSFQIWLHNWAQTQVRRPQN